MSKIKLIATALLVAWTIQPTVSHAQETSLAPAPEQHQTAAKGVEGGRLKLHGWWFDLEIGELLAHEVGDGWKTLTG